MKKTSKNVALLFAIALFAILIMSFFAIRLQINVKFIDQTEMQAYQISKWHDEKIKNLSTIPSIDNDFASDEIIVILNAEHSGIALQNSEYDYDEVIEELDDVDNIDVDTVKELFQVEEDESVPPTYRRMLSLKLETPGKKEIIETIRELNKLDMILAAEPVYNYEVREESEPSDTYYLQQWGLHGSYGTDVELAWNIARGTGVKVGLFEKNIDKEHEDLKDRVIGQNFTLAGNANHGTQVGSIISAIADNNKGIAGISNASLYLLDSMSLTNSLNAAFSQGIKIANASFSYTRNGVYVPANMVDAQAIVDYGARGGLLICSAGNAGVDTDERQHYPSSYGDARLHPNINNVISVGAINEAGERCDFSNYGRNSVQIYAPGENLYAAKSDNQYAMTEGTSIAAPHVTGAAALLLSINPELSGEEIKDIILENADDITIEGDSAKLLNIGSAVMDYAEEEVGVQNANYNNGKWTFKLRNYSTQNTRVVYNGKMCFEDNAKNWTGLTDIKYVDVPAKGTRTVDISENYFATHAAFSYIIGDKRYIVYVDELNKNTGEFGIGTSIKGYDSYTQNNMKVSLIGKNGGTWLIELTNNTGIGRTFYYNERLCFEGDAKNWSGLSDIKQVYLANGATTSVPLEISEYGTATSIAISYMDGVYRKIFYANNLDASGTMISKASTIDTTNPPDSCLAEGSLITLADGSQKAVEDLTGDEMLLVWDLYTGTFGSAPILCIDSDPVGHYQVIRLFFSDGTTVDVISEHGFFDIDLNEYVYLDKDAAEYIGHDFWKQGTNGMTAVTLVDVEIETEVTVAYSPVTYGHLCYYVNGMLSMPGGIDGLFNIFEVDAETMTYDAEGMAADIEEYGLYTYEELNALVPVPEIMFDAVNGQYLKVAVGKGMITLEQIGELVDRYSDLFV